METYQDLEPSYSINEESELSKAIFTLCKSLAEDESYYRSWKDNIAMAFKDEYDRTLEAGYGKDIHTIANKAADNFLQLLITKP